MTTDTVEREKRSVLRSRDVNQTMFDEKTLLVETPPDLPRQPSSSMSEEKDERTAEEKFQQVADSRVPEDLSGDLDEMGMKVWSVDDFQYISTIGYGSTALVYRASEKVSGYHVALKVQEYDEHNISSDVELDIHSQLNHRNTVKMIDYFFSHEPFGDPDATDDDIDCDSDSSDPKKKYLYMILEMCEKGSLFDVIERYKGGSLNECDAARYFRGCVQALKYLHAKDLVHCDVKTANFLVDSSDVIKLADFETTVRSDELEVLGGSTIFMAPEHLQSWRLGGGNFDHRVDIYGLGVTLFQILVGDFPFYVIEKDEDVKNANSLLKCFGKLTLGDGPAGFDPKRLDVRMLEDHSSKATFEMPPISFPDRMSAEARDLISRLMAPNPAKRISLADALDHAWLHCCRV